MEQPTPKSIDEMIKVLNAAIENIHGLKQRLEEARKDKDEALILLGKLEIKNAEELARLKRNHDALQELDRSKDRRIRDLEEQIPYLQNELKSAKATIRGQSEKIRRIVDEADRYLVDDNTAPKSNIGRRISMIANEPIEEDNLLAMSDVDREEIVRRRSMHPLDQAAALPVDHEFLEVNEQPREVPGTPTQVEHLTTRILALEDLVDWQHKQLEKIRPLANEIGRAGFEDWITREKIQGILNQPSPAIVAFDINKKRLEQLAKRDRINLAFRTIDNALEGLRDAIQD